MERLELLPDGRVRYRLKKPWIDGTTHLVMDPLVFMQRLASFIPAPYKNLTRYHGVFASNSNLRPSLITLLPQEVLVTPSSASCEEKAASTAEEGSSSQNDSASSSHPQSPQGQKEAETSVPSSTNPKEASSREIPQVQDGSQRTPPGSAASGALGPEAPSAAKTIRSRRLPWAELLKRTFRIDLTQCPKCQGLLIIIAFITDPAIVYKILSHLHLPTEIPNPEPSRREEQDEQLSFEFEEPGDEEERTHRAPCPQRGPPRVEWVRL
jgi:hypothetical protein